MSQEQDITTIEEQQLAAAKVNYFQLQEVIRLWQEEQDSAWIDSLQPADSSPFFTVESLPASSVLGLWQRLNLAAGDSTEVEQLQKSWQQFKTGKTVLPDGRLSRLQLAVSGTAQLARKQLGLARTVEDQPFGPCPVCGEEEVIATLLPPTGKRYLHCLVCGHDWPVKSVGCVHCGSERADNHTYLRSAEYPGIEMVACLDCGSYFKQVDLRELAAKDLTWEDIRSLPLNYAAERWLAEQAAKQGKLQ